MIGYPFNSHVTYDEHDTPEFDRAISAAPLKNLIAKLFSNGVLPNPSTNLQVVSGDAGMTVIVRAGFCIINGGLKLEDEDKTLVVQAANANHPRIDTVVMRWNDNDDVRACDLYVVEGTPAANPVRPDLTRTASVYELGLADLYITAGSTSIDSFRITDTRLDSNRCGYISSISEFDTTTLYNQIQADLDNFQEVEQADFLAWYESMKDQLSEDAAGNLQLEIDEVNGRYNGLTQDIAEWVVLNQLPQVGREKTLYLITGEEETHYLGDVSDDTSVINDNVVSNGTTYSSNKIANLLSHKADAEVGKGLSKNDYTDADKAKVNSAITQLKTVNGQSLVGTGNINIQGGSGANINDTIISYNTTYSSEKIEERLADVGADLTTSLLIDSLYARNRKLDFAWSLPKAMFALVIDDCLPNSISEAVTNANTKSVPLNMAYIVEHFNDQATNETVLQAIKRGIANGGEALQHGQQIITADNIDNENHLKKCFLDNKEIAIANGINPRGMIVMGGGGELYGDIRTDRWVRALYDYSDGYGTSEPYYHRRSTATSLFQAKAEVDVAIANKSFWVFYSHGWQPWWGDLIDYVRSKGCDWYTYANVYDTYGTTKAEKNAEARIKALEDIIFAKVLVSISASKVATSFYEGATLNLDDITVIALWDDETESNVTDDATIDASNVDMTTAGEYAIDVSYTFNHVTKTTTIPITVEEIPVGQVLDSINASKSTTQYVQNATLDLSDISVEAVYTNSETADVTANAVIDASNVDMSTVGTYPIDISYTENNITKTTSIIITVVENTGTLIFSASTLNANVTTSSADLGSSINTTQGKKYTYEFDYEITRGGTVDVRTSCDGAGASLVSGVKAQGDTGHVKVTTTATITRSREPMVARSTSDTSGYAIKLTNVTIREKDA